MADEESSTRRTSDGFLTVRALRSGMVDVVSWRHLGAVHTVRLSLARANPEPPLFLVEHTISSLDNREQHRELYDDVRKARREYMRIRKSPRSTYEEGP